MHDFSLLYELFVIFCSAILVVLLFHRIKVPPIVGLLFCGIVIGPYGLNLMSHKEDVEMLAEIGVVLLLFTIGLEFSLTELRRIKRYVLLGGAMQVFGTAGLAVALARFFGMSFPHALFLSLIFTLSSTAIVLSVLAARGEMETQHGRMILGILLFQDLCVVPMMLITPLLQGEGSLQILPIALSLGKALLMIGLILALAILVVPRVLERIVRARLREILVLGIVVICIGTAWLTSALGLSLALGAFIAGLAISESPYSHQAVAEILPFKDVFNSLFFVSVGMLLDVRLLMQNFPMISVLVLGTILGKALVGGLAIRLLSGSARLALLVGLAIAQIGEFSFVLAKFGLQFQLLNESFYQGFLATTVLTMIATPGLIALAPKLAQRMPQSWERLRVSKKEEEKSSGAHLAHMREHVIIVGFGLNGRYLARVLKDSGIPYCILELNPHTVRSAKSENEPICFGDATRLEILRLVNFSQARVLVMTVAEMPIARRVISTARHNHPELYIIVRTRFAAEVEELYRLGATQVIAAEFETAIEIFGHVLAEYDLPRNVISAYVETVRREGASPLRRPFLPPASLERLRQLLAGNIVENYLVLENSPAAGKTLAQLALRQRTGATIIAIVRDHHSHSNPSSDFTLASGDLLVVMGTHRALDKAAQLLETASLANS